jgi:hypothetical protein
VRHQFGVEVGEARVRGGDLLVGEFAHFRIVAHRFGGGEVAARLRFGGQRDGDRFELRELARQVAEAIGCRRSRRIGEQAFDFLASLEQRFELAAQAGDHRPLEAAAVFGRRRRRRRRPRRAAAGTACRWRARGRCRRSARLRATRRSARAAGG